MKILLTFVLLCFQAILFAQPIGRVIKITFESKPTYADVEIAKLKYNKDFAYSMTIDDGKNDVWNIAYKLLSGQPVVKSNVYKGIDYGSGTNDWVQGGYNSTDGCGHFVKFKCGLAINARFLGTSELFISWAQLQEMYEAGWDVLNHSYNHEPDPFTPINWLLNDPITYEQHIEGNSDTIFKKLGFYPRHFVVPSNSDPILCNFGLTDECTEINTHGMVAIYTQNWQWFGPTVETDTAFGLDFFQLDRNPIPNEVVNWSSIIDTIKNVANNANTTNRYWLNNYTHSVRRNGDYVPFTASLGYPFFKQYMDYIENNYGASGSDNIWMAGLQEVYEYLYVRDHATYTTKMDGNTLTITLLFDSKQPDQRHFDLSFLAKADKPIKNITIEGDGYATSNQWTGLVNVELIENPMVATNQDVVSPEIVLENITPNPSKNRITAHIQMAHPKQLTFSLINTTGQIKILKNRQVPFGKSKIDFNISSLEPGVYLLKMTDGQSTQTKRFVKIKD